MTSLLINKYQGGIEEENYRDYDEFSKGCARIRLLMRTGYKWHYLLKRTDNENEKKMRQHLILAMKAMEDFIKQIFFKKEISDKKQLKDPIPICRSCHHFWIRGLVAQVNYAGGNEIG